MAIYRGTGGSSTTTDETTVNAVNQKAAEAATSATNAASSASSAATSASTANAKAILASNAAENATTASAQAFSSKEAAAISSASAAAAQVAAENAQTAAEAAETNAILYGNMANTAAGDADADRILAEAAASTAQTYATQVTASTNAAAASATEAALSETNAAASETAAASSASSAATSETNAGNSADAANVSANDAATSEANAAASETASAASAASASTSATAAANSATAASTSASAAAASESNASTSAANAAVSETNAASSESAAATSATAASAAKDAALAALDSFDDRYLGVKATAPTVDNDGNPLVSGALYFDSTTDAMNVYDGSQWLAAYADLSGALIATSNLSDLTNAAAARTNLGLGTAATTDSTAYATAAQGVLADSAIQAADLGTAAYTASTDYATAAQGALADSALQSIPDNYLLNTGDSITGDLSFGDNDKAIFGAGSDLQIYHDGSNSYIDEVGTGSLYIDAENFVLRNNGDNGKWINAYGDTINFLYNDSVKLATTSTGIDVTGNVTIPTGNKVAFDVDGLTYITEDQDERMRMYVANTEFVRLTNTTTDEVRILPYGGNTYFGGNIDVTGTATMDGLTVDVVRTNQASITASTASTTLDFNTANNFVVTMTSSTTFTFSNVTGGQSGIIYLIQDATGGRVFTLPSVAKTPLNGASIVQNTGASNVSILSYTVLDSNNVLVNYVGDFA